MTNTEGEKKAVISEYNSNIFKVTPIDEATIKKAIDGNEKAFETIFMGTYRYVFAIVRKYLKNDQDAYDAIQETYTKTYKGLARLASPSSFYPWLHRIAENCAKDILALNNLNEKNFSVEQSEVILEDDQNHQFDLSADITEVLKQLPEEQTELLIRVYYDKMRVAEIARLQGTPVTTVYNRLNAAKKKLKQLLKIRGIEKPIYSGELISILSLAIRNAIGTHLLSMAVAEEILHNVANSKNKKGAFIISLFARKQRSKAALKISTLLLSACAIITAIAFLIIGVVTKAFQIVNPSDNYSSSLSSSFVSHDYINNDNNQTHSDFTDDLSNSQNIHSASTAPSDYSQHSSNAQTSANTSIPSSSQTSPTTNKKPASSSSLKSSSTVSTSSPSTPVDNVKFFGSFTTTEVFGTSIENQELDMAISGDTVYAVVKGNLVSLKSGSTAPKVLVKNFNKLYGTNAKCLNVYNKKIYWLNKNDENKFVLNRCDIDGTNHFTKVFSEFDCTFILKMTVAKDGIYFCAGIHGDFDYRKNGTLYKTDYDFNIKNQLENVADYTIIKDNLYYLGGGGNCGIPYKVSRETFENPICISADFIHYSSISSFGEYLILDNYSPYTHSEYAFSTDLKVMDVVSGEIVRAIYGEAGEEYDVKDVSDHDGGTIIFTHNGTPKMFIVKTGKIKTLSDSGGAVYKNYRYTIKSNCLYRSDIDGNYSKKIY